LTTHLSGKLQQQQQNSTTPCFKKHAQSVKNDKYPIPPSEFGRELSHFNSARITPSDMSATRESTIVPETPTSTAERIPDSMGTRGKASKEAPRAAQPSTSLLAMVEAALKTVGTMSSKVIGKATAVRQLEAAITMIKEDTKTRKTTEPEHTTTEKLDVKAMDKKLDFVINFLTKELAPKSWAPIPQNYVGRKRIPNPDYPVAIHDIGELEIFIDKRMQDLQITSPDVQKFAFKILNHVTLPKTVLRHLRSNYLPSFSAMKWEDVFPLFQHSLTHNPPYDDHRNIPPYILQRSRLPITLFKSICAELDTSRKTLGTREELQNEAAVQLYFQHDPRLIQRPNDKPPRENPSLDDCKFWSL
jgi:hypothetical protein